MLSEESAQAAFATRRKWSRLWVVDPLDGTKVFVQDMSANGLSLKADDGGPDTWDEKNAVVSFDGEWRKAKMSEADYTKTYQTHDEAYSRMLQALIETLKKPS